MDLKKTNAPVNTITYNKSKLEEPTGNIYEAITIMAKRANQINTEIKKELIEKLEEFYGKSVARIKAEFFDLIKKRMLAERMRETITENVRITPNEVKEFYKSLPKDSIPYINSKIKIIKVIRKFKQNIITVVQKLNFKYLT